jgi:hypothetical protein
MKTKPKLVRIGGMWHVKFGRALYRMGSQEDACIKARWLWWHQPKVDLQ